MEYGKVVFLWSLAFSASVLVVSASIILVLAISRPVVYTEECSCVAHSPKYDFQSSDLVFMGHLVGHKTLNLKGFESNSIYEFRAERIWKGPLVETIYLTDHGNYEGCGPSLSAPGGPYVVFSYKFSYGRCTRSGIFSESGQISWYDGRIDDLKEASYMGSWQAPVPGTASHEEVASSNWKVAIIAILIGVALALIIVVGGLKRLRNRNVDKSGHA